jgi:hypothetical protein
MRVILWILLAMAAAMVLRGVLVGSLPDAVIWAFGAVMVAMLIKVEKHERDDE